jgi:hypothetical protein
VSALRQPHGCDGKKIVVVAAAAVMVMMTMAMAKHICLD